MISEKETKKREKKKYESANEYEIQAHDNTNKNEKNNN